MMAYVEKLCIRNLIYPSPIQKHRYYQPLAERAIISTLHAADIRMLYYCLHVWEGIVLPSGEKGLPIILSGGNQLEFQQISSFLTETYGIPQPLQSEHHTFPCIIIT
jgi:hypothetical protein